MAITPISLARISQNLRAFNLLEALRANQAGLFRAQNQLATGWRFTQPSEDPLRSATALDFDRRMDRLGAVRSNLRDVDGALNEGEAATRDGVDLMMEARRLASETVSDTSSPDERRALGVVVASLLDQMVTVGNRQHRGAYLFSGKATGTRPFELTADGVLYRGDEGRRETIIDSDLSQDFFTISGKDYFSAVSAGVQGVVDLDPALTRDTRIGELRGTTGRGVQLGQIVVSDGVQQVSIDLSSAATAGDIVDRLNADLPAGVQATMGVHGISISFVGPGPDQITISEVGGGHTARDLGLTGDFSRFAARAEPDLDPMLMAHTPLSALQGGLGVNVNDSLTVRNGGRTATIGFGGAATVEDVLNRLNQSETGVWARIAPDGRTLQVQNRISGADLSIAEAGGQLATALGIRSMRPDTRLADLNDGLGIETVAGSDARITTRSGATIDVDLDGLTDLQGVIGRFNAAGGGAITAALATQGNGIVITDNTAGGGTLTIERLNMSPAIDGLGLNVSATGNQLVGSDVNPVRVDSPFTALVELRDCLQADDRRGIGLAADRLERTLGRMQQAQGELAAQAKNMGDRSERVDAESDALKVLQSNVRDADITDAVVRFQQLQTALQANMMTASRIMNLSLLDYLR